MVHMDVINSRRLVLSGLTRVLLTALLVASTFLMAALWVAPNQALAVTSAEKQAEVDEAFRRLDALQTEINQLTIDLENAMIAHALAEAKMFDAQARETAAKERIAELQEQLGERATSMYRNGNGSYLDVLFGAKSFNDFINVMDMINRVNEQDARLVLETKEVKAEAEAARIEYTEQERITRETQDEITQIRLDTIAAGEALMAEIVLLEKEAAELLAQEEAAAEAARQAAATYATGPAGPVTEEQLARLYALGIQYPFFTPMPISSHFGPRSFDGFHYGTDFACPTGTPILAVAGGTVVAAGTGGAMGVYVIIAHGNGIRSIYMHNSALAVTPGQPVNAGDVICLSGSTGNSTGPHLHLQIEVDLTPVNPMLFLI